MVLSAGQSESNKTPIKPFLIGLLVFCVTVGLFVGFCLSDWVLGVQMGISLLILGACLPLVSAFFGLICIPPMMLVDRLTGYQYINKKESNKENSPDRQEGGK